MVMDALAPPALKAQAKPMADPGNEYLTPGPAEMSATKVRVPEHGDMLVVTVRNTGCTCTVFLSKADAALWGKQLTDQADDMSGSGLFTG